MNTPTLGGWMVHVMRQADGALSFEEALHVILDSMKHYFPCQSVAVILVDEDTKQPRIKISRQISYTFTKEHHPGSPPPAAERAMLEQTPLIFNDLDPASDLYRQIKLEHDFTSAVLAPIVRNQRGIGYIFCDRSGGERFDESDLLHLQVIGFLIGNLMEKFDLIRQSKSLSQYDDSSRALLYKAFVPAAAREMQRARTHRYGLAFALLAVEQFRKYVETYGIEKAHDLLAEVVRAIRTQISDTDVLARFAADQFILCLSGIAPEATEGKLRGIRDAVTQQAVGQREEPIQVTIGAIALSTPEELAMTIQDLMSRLGKALVLAQGAGVGSVRIMPASEAPAA